MRAITQKALSKVHQTSDPMKQIKEQVGNINDLQTNAKGSVVDAANELLRRLIVTDTCGVIGNEGEEVEAQALIDEIADKVMEKLLLKTGDSADNIVKFESGDNVKAQSWTDVDVMETKEKHKSLFEKISTMFKNVRFLYKLLGTTDISTIKDGTVTGILNALDNVAFTGIYADLHNKPLALPASDVYTWAKQATKPAYTKSEVGLGNANNTSDKDKPVSTAQQTALDKKVNFTDISRSTAVNVAGKKALDAIEKNASVDGTLAHDISQIYSNLDNVNLLDVFYYFLDDAVDYINNFDNITHPIIFTHLENAPEDDNPAGSYWVFVLTLKRQQQSVQICFSIGANIIKFRTKDGENVTKWQQI